MNRLWYNSFRDHRLFESLTTCFWALGVDKIHEHYDGYRYAIEDITCDVGAGGEACKEFREEVLATLELAGKLIPSDEVVERVVQLSDECLSRRHKLYPSNKWGRYIRQCSDRLLTEPGKCEKDKAALVFAIRCSGCSYWLRNRTNICPICGAESSLGL